MIKRIIAVGILALIIAGSVKIAVSQEGPERQQDQVSAALLSRMEVMEQSQKQILQKLDTILANQQKIFGELDIIKIRATKR